MPRCLCAALTTFVLVVVAAPAGAQALPEVPTPTLIERAVASGELSRADGLRMLAYALGRPDRLPQRFVSHARWDGTFHLRRLQREAPRMKDDGARREVLGIVAPQDPREPSIECGALSLGPLPESYESDHFFIEYAPDITFRGDLTIEDYAESLDRAWEREVIDFGYAAPPILEETPREKKYPVRIGPLGAGLYGFVSPTGTYAGEVGDNEDTPWEEDDAVASCMGLNSDYETGFEQLTVGSARQRLDATTAHEFLHSIQFGYGALDNGDHEPDLSFSEGHATWMEDEVFDGADDNHNYLYPDFRSSMGEHSGNEYSYWLTWRGLTQRFGTGTPGPSEDIIQRFWEITSQEQLIAQDAFQKALEPTGLTLAQGFHDYAIASRFMKACGGGYALPHCFEEADAFAAVAGGRPEPDGAIAALGDTYAGTEDAPAQVENDYALNWVDLPASNAPIQAVLKDADGLLRLSVICDTGSGLRTSARDVTGADGTATVRFDPVGCQSPPSAVITNEKQTAPDPDEATATAYTLKAEAAPPEPPAPTPEQPAPPAPAPAPPPATDAPITPFVTPGPVACAAGTRLGRAVATPTGSGLRFAFAPRGGSSVGVDVFQASVGDRVGQGRLVARFAGRTRSFTWRGASNLPDRRVRDGYLFVRFRARNATGVDVKRVALQRVDGKFRARPAFARSDACATLASFKLLRPVFGGPSRRGITVAYRLGAAATVTIEAVVDGAVVRRFRQGARPAGRTFRVRVGARRFAEGDVTFRLQLQREGARPLVARLVARRLGSS